MNTENIFSEHLTGYVPCLQSNHLRLNASVHRHAEEADNIPAEGEVVFNEFYTPEL